VIAPTFPGAFQNAGFFQLPDQSKSRALGDADTFSDVAKPRIRIVRKANQHVRVIAEKGPVLEEGRHKKAPTFNVERKFMTN